MIITCALVAGFVEKQHSWIEISPSTFDGLSLAWACAHHLAEKLQAFTLFATHYFELTSLPDTLTDIANVHLDATEYGDDIVFMHTVKDGPANQSYGIQVAKLAGIPNDVLQFASHKLGELEAASLASDNAAPAAVTGTTKAKSSSSPQPDLFARTDSQLQEAVSALNLDEMTPRAALDALYDLKRKL